ncbi:MAG: hypothetical protein ABIT06_05985 [Saprospiraceae bacterium]
MSGRKFSLLVSCVFIAFLFISCQKDECQDRDYGVLQTDPNILDYEKGATKQAFIYKDSAGIEHRYELTTDLNFIRDHLHTDTCDNGVIYIMYKSEYFLRSFTHLVAFLAGFAF